MMRVLLLGLASIVGGLILNYLRNGIIKQLIKVLFPWVSERRIDIISLILAPIFTVVSASAIIYTYRSKQIIDQNIEPLKLQSNLPLLGDKALNHDDREAFDQIIRIAKTAPENSALKNSAIGEVRGFIYQVDDGRFISESLSGSLTNDIKIPTDQVIVSLSNSDSKVRAKAARILGSRREKGVPDSLLQVFRTDKHLRVAYYALISFGYITKRLARPIVAGQMVISETQLIEMFDIDKLEQWWKEHAEKVKEGLPEMK